MAETNNINHIVCATRGGEGSRAVQLAAIQHAKTNQATLTFLYVTDPDSVGEFEASLAPAVEAELSWMGNTLLRIARQRAGSANITAEIIVRIGAVRQQISQFLQDSQADLLLLGAPRGTTANVFGDDEVERFALTIQETTNIPVEIIRPEEV